MTTIERFYSSMILDKSGCLLWQKAIDREGYARFKVGGRMVSAHRFSYESVNGPIPDGLTIDHRCRVRHCVNAQHLEAVTIRENLMRGDTPAARNAAKTICKHGHSLAGAYVHRGSRHCRTCLRIRSRARHKTLIRRTVNGKRKIVGKRVSR